jgi:hypothetical protein
MMTLSSLTTHSLGYRGAKRVVRKPGAMSGKIRIKKNFDKPLPKELLGSFAEKS